MRLSAKSRFLLVPFDKLRVLVGMTNFRFDKKEDIL
jgi:hypothetical protein